MTTKTLTGGKALVAGANGGMGRAIAIALAGQGVDTALMGRNEEAVNAVAEACRKHGAAAFPVICDISKTETIEAAVGGAIDKLAGLNYLVNCAGISAEGKLHETDLVGSEAILDTNLRAFLYLARYSLPEINKQSGGAVVKIGAVNHPYSGVNTYLAASQGGEGLAEALFKDVREYGTKVCTIRPGWVNTPLVTAEKGIDAALMIQPEDISQTVLYVLSMSETACPTEITILPQRSPYV